MSAYIIRYWHKAGHLATMTVEAPNKTEAKFVFLATHPMPSIISETQYGTPRISSITKVAS